MAFFELGDEFNFTGKVKVKDRGVGTLEYLVELMSDSNVTVNLEIKEGYLKKFLKEDDLLQLQLRNIQNKINKTIEEYQVVLGEQREEEQRILKELECLK